MVNKYFFHFIKKIICKRKIIRKTRSLFIEESKRWQKYSSVTSQFYAITIKRDTHYIHKQKEKYIPKENQFYNDG